jgi:phosphatidylglycerophosphate synthase
MIDARLQPMQRRLLAPMAQALVARGIGADSLSVAGFVLGALTVPALAWHLWGLSLALLAANRLLDGLDGAVARLTGPTDRGAFLDIALDFVFYALFPLGFALAAPENALPAAVLIAAFVGTGSSFLAFATLAAKRGKLARAYPTKGIHYLGGLTEGFETIAVFAAMCLAPAAFPLLALIYAAACGLSTALRWRQGWLAFGASS